ncbi:MAG: YeeE/YedE family protein [Thermodesulfovibrionales bacterium]
MTAAPYPLIMGICLLLGLITGMVLHRSDYCIAGMFRDLFLFKRAFMLRTLLLLIVSSMVLFELARLTGLLPLYPFPLLYSPTPANLIGGFLFGIGMVLAGGCVVGTLYKMGAGSILSAAAFAGLVLGSALYAEIHPFWASFIKKTTFFSGSITLPQILKLPPVSLIAPAAAVGSFFLLRWKKAGGLVRQSAAEGYLQPWKAALLLSLIGLSSYVLIGMPLGITSTYAKLSGYLGSIFFTDHAAGLAYYQAVPLKYVHPLTNTYLEGGGGPRFDALAAVQFPLVAGIILGSLSSALSLKEFRIYYKVPAGQYISAFAGGIMMGLASRMAPTCNVWHLMGGLPILAASSILFLAGLLPGAWFGSRLLTGLVLKNPAMEKGRCRI